MGGALTGATVVTASAANTLAIAGLQASTTSSTDQMVVADATTGVLKTIPASSLSTNWSLTGNAGTTLTNNFLGTTDNVPLQFKVNNVFAGMLEPGNISLGTNAGLARQQGLVNSTQSALNTANVAIGNSALAANVTGSKNTAIGNLALTASTAGNNTAVGDSALVANTAGTSNTAIGIGAGQTTTIGSNNTFIGVDADLVTIKAFLATLNGGTGLTNVTAIGYGAKVGASNSMVLGGTGTYAVNVGIGNTSPTNTLHVTPKVGVNPVRFEGLQASTSSADLVVVADATGVLRTTTTGGSGGWSLTGNAGTTLATNFLGTTDNVPLQFQVNKVYTGMLDPSDVFLGTNAGLAKKQGLANSIQAFLNNLPGTGNIGIGSQALAASIANNNTAVGASALAADSIGNSNVAMGNLALSANKNGNTNTAIGYKALAANTVSNNTAMGSSALAANTTGTGNVAMGISALAANTTAGNNTAVGGSTLASNTTGAYNIAVGGSALAANLTGNYNTAIGYQALTNSTGATNTAVGSNALNRNTASNNTAVGSSALYYNTTGTSNTAVGTSALSGITTGASNTAIGLNAGQTNTTGSNNTFLGTSADVTTGALSNATAIGYNAKVAASNSIVLGGTGTNAVNVGIGTTAPTSTLQVAGSMANALRILTSTSSFTLTNNDYTVISKAGTPETLTLPDPTTCSGRIYRIVNYSGDGNGANDITLSIGVYYVNVGIGTTTSLHVCAESVVAFGSKGPIDAVSIQSDGTNWYVIGQ